MISAESTSSPLSASTLRYCPVYGDRDPRSVTPESLLALRAKVAARVSLTEAHRVIKIWRALWKKMAAMGYCQRDADPSLIFSNTAPDPRQDVWQHREVLRLVQCAWRLGYRGLAAAMAVGWDTMLSPVVRSIKHERGIHERVTGSMAACFMESVV